MNWNRLLTLGIGVACLCLLVGLSFSARWVGGEGGVAACAATKLYGSEAEVVRGQLMEAGDAFTKYQLCDGSIIYLDKNTQVELDAYPADGRPTQLQLIQGRLIVDGLAEIKARNLIATVPGGGCEIIHYSWLDQVDVTPLVEQGCTVNGPDQPEYEFTNRYETFESKLIGAQPFAPGESSAQDFYRWTELEFKGL